MSLEGKPKLDSNEYFVVVVILSLINVHLLVKKKKVLVSRYAVFFLNHVNSKYILEFLIFDLCLFPPA